MRVPGKIRRGAVPHRDKMHQYVTSNSILHSAHTM